MQVKLWKENEKWLKDFVKKNPAFSVSAYVNLLLSKAQAESNTKAKSK